MKSMRELERDLKNIAGRIIKADEEGKAPDPKDLEAMTDTVGLLIDGLKGKDRRLGGGDAG